MSHSRVSYLKVQHNKKGNSKRGRAFLYLKRRVAAEVEQRLDDADVALVDGDVEGSLPSLVPDVDVLKLFFVTDEEPE